MKRINVWYMALYLFVGLVLLFAVLNARAADVPFSANLKSYSSSPANAYINLVLIDQGQDAQGRPNICLTPTGVAAVASQVLAASSDGSISTTITPGADLTCGNLAGTTHYRIEIRQKQGAKPDPKTDPLIASNVVTVGPGPFVLISSTPVVSPPSPPAGIDYTSYLVTRPFRRLSFGQFPATCNALKDWIERTDPDAPGQVLYHCNASGTGWDLATGSGTGGSANFVDNETPSGPINGTNTGFVLTQVPSPPLSLLLRRNGQVLVPSVDFSLSAAAITILGTAVPLTGDVLRASYRVGGSSANFADFEIPGGLVNGSNLNFTLAHSPAPGGNLLLMRNGLVLQSGVDYSLSGSSITFNSGAQPEVGDSLYASYRY
jgi:hypothetical protein